MPSASEVEFGSFLVYSPKGATHVSRNSKTICFAVKEDGFINLKNGPRRAIPFVVELLQSRLAGSAIEELFAENPILVPAPRSAPAKPGTLYPTRLICEQMVARGLGSEVRLLLERVIAVPKAATSAPGQRPTIQAHYDSLRTTEELVAGSSILVVDDVVTRGTMLIASVNRLAASYPHANIRAFAFVRTMSGAGVEVPSVVDPCKGTLHAGDAWGYRRP